MRTYNSLIEPTYFEGAAADLPKAQCGHPKEKRNDRPLPALGVVLDASGFTRRSKAFAGRVDEHSTLADMLAALKAPAGALAVMDRGGAAAFDPGAALAIQTASRQTIRIHKTISDDGREARLHCYSAERAEKERAIVERFATRFETARAQLHQGLSRPRIRKRIDAIWERIGRLKEKAGEPPNATAFASPPTKAEKKPQP